MTARLTQNPSINLMTDSSFDVLIAGGGVIGLTTGILLAEGGLRVAIFDQSLMGTESSWAGAGILSPPQCGPEANELDQLRSHSVRGLASFSAELDHLTGINNGFSICGGLVIPDANENHEKWPTEWKKNGIAFIKPDYPHAFLTKYGLSTFNSEVYWLPEKGQIRNPWHMRALLARLNQLGVSLFEKTEVLDWGLCSNGQIRSFITAAGEFHSSWFILCAGSWSGDLARKLGVNVPVTPVKGQIILYQGQVGLLPGIIEQGKRYLVPRSDGRILCGSTEEYSGFDKTCNPESVSQLHEWAATIAPILKNCPIEQKWTGLRPGSRDNAPYLCFIPNQKQAILASGHFRSGLQLSWGSADLISREILQKKKPINLKAFSLDRPCGALMGMFKN